MSFLDVFKRLLFEVPKETKNFYGYGRATGYNMNYQNIYKAKIKNKKRKSGRNS